MAKQRFTEFCSYLDKMESSGHHTLILSIFCCNLFGPPQRLAVNGTFIVLLVMMSWFAAYDRINYTTRYLSAYVLQMMILPESHPDARTFLINGEFAVQRWTGNSFGRIPHDHTIEVTANRDTTSRGGIV